MTGHVKCFIQMVTGIMETSGKTSEKAREN